MAAEPKAAKGPAAMILELSGKPKGDSAAEEADEAKSDDEGYKAAAEEMISAVKGGDAGALSEALRSFLDIHLAADRDEAEEAPESKE